MNTSHLASLPYVATSDDAGEWVTRLYLMLRSASPSDARASGVEIVPAGRLLYSVRRNGVEVARVWRSDRGSGASFLDVVAARDRGAAETIARWFGAW